MTSDSSLLTNFAQTQVIGVVRYLFPYLGMTYTKLRFVTRYLKYTAVTHFNLGFYNSLEGPRGIP